MNLGELSDLLDRARAVLRVEARDRYVSDSDRDGCAGSWRASRSPMWS